MYVDCVLFFKELIVYATFVICLDPCCTWKDKLVLKINDSFSGGTLQHPFPLSTIPPCTPPFLHMSSGALGISQGSVWQPSQQFLTGKGAFPTTYLQTNCLYSQPRTVHKLSPSCCNRPPTDPPGAEISLSSTSISCL